MPHEDREKTKKRGGKKDAKRTVNNRICKSRIDLMAR